MKYNLTSPCLAAKAGGLHAAPRGDQLLFARFTTLAVTKRVMNSSHTGRLALDLAYSKLDKEDVLRCLYGGPGYSSTI